VIDTGRTRLGRATLAALPASVERPRYDTAMLKTGIVHIGLGAFARAHLAVYTDDVLSDGDRRWGIVGVNLHSAAQRQALAPQDGLYTLVTRGNGTDRLRVIGALRDVLSAADQLAEVLDVLASPDVCIVSLTVTEKGYCHDPSSGRLDERHPAIVADLAHPETPSSMPGLIVEALRRRRAAGIAPFAVLSCDNLPNNGKVAGRVVTRFAELIDAGLGAFIAGNVAFPSTMVDRITPATSDADRATVAAALGVEDAWPVVAEPFRQWVIEDRFPAGRPAWETAGAILTDDVHPFETMKLRCLNGAHSTLAYLSVVAGVETVADAMADAQLPKVIRRLWDDDIIATVPPVPGTDVAAYTRDLEARFRNPDVRHRTLQIASDGSQKLGPRLLVPAAELIASGKAPSMIPLTIAAWMAFLRGHDGTGRTWTVADPMAPRLTALASDAGDNATALANALFAVAEIFPAPVADNAAFRAATVAHLDTILTTGVPAALAAALSA
jgi:fructuronate reductase